MSGLFDNEFYIDISNLSKNSAKKAIKKTAELLDTDQNENNTTKLLKSKKISVIDKLHLIEAKVLKVLGKQKNNILVIKDTATFEDYISKVIETGVVAIDTETHNSLDPVTTKMIGLCLYAPGLKQAYIPVEHRDPRTKIRLPWQCTAEDCRKQLQRLKDAKTYTVMHNGKFDYEVIKCSCGIAIPPQWDTEICARLLNENEKSNLKEQYIKYIDSSQEKYKIDTLFENILYVDVNPDIFAYYAATDSLMTYKLYEVQKEKLAAPEYGPHLDLLGKHEVKGLRWLFHNIEMPIVEVTAEMELLGVCVDQKLGQRLKDKYNGLLSNVDTEISALIETIAPVIKRWRLTKEANEKTKVYVPKKTKMTEAKIREQYPLEDEKGRYKVGKSKTEQLDEEVNLASPAQLAILFYDVLNVPQSSQDSRKTGKDELKKINEKLQGYLPKLAELEVEDVDEEDLEEDMEEALELSEDQTVILKLGTAAKLSDLILKRRAIAKLLTTYIDVIPDLAKHWPDGRIRFHLHSMGTDTGRYSSGGKIKYVENDEPIEVSGINIQNIPSRGEGGLLRLLFVANTKEEQISFDNVLEVPEITEIETINGYQYCRDLHIGDKLLINTNEVVGIKNIVYNSEKREYFIQI